MLHFISQMGALFYFASSYLIESAYTQLDTFLELTDIASNNTVIVNIRVSINIIYGIGHYKY